MYKMLPIFLIVLLNYNFSFQKFVFITALL